MYEALLQPGYRTWMVILLWKYVFLRLYEAQLKVISVENKQHHVNVKHNEEEEKKKSQKRKFCFPMKENHKKY